METCTRRTQTAAQHNLMCSVT